jgi:histidinol phosphatase-like PHP family hydrolase
MTDWPHTDMHLHATHYRLEGARTEMTVTYIIRQLEARSYETIGIVEHLDTNPKHPLTCLEALVKEFRSISNHDHRHMDLFVGAELDYQGDAITISDAPAIKRELGLDYYLAAAHGLGDGVTSTPTFIENHHRRLMGIVEQYDYVDIIAHPWCGGHTYAKRGWIEAWHFELIPEHYLNEFIDAVKYHGMAVEINHKAMADANDPAFQAYLGKLRNAGVPITLGSDAHSMAKIGDAAKLESLLQNTDLSPAQLWRPAKRV